MEPTAARLLTLLSLLQQRPHWTAPEIAERLGVTPRTVRRDVSRLRDLGYPVEAEPGRGGGYRLGVGAALPPLLLSDDEAVAVAVGLRAAASSGMTGHEGAAVAALAKLEQVLPARLRERVLALNAAVVLVPPGDGRFVDPDVLLTLAQGCRRLERIRFGYRDRTGAVSSRRAEPYRLVHAGRHWYLVARDLDRDAWRTFRIDRMTAPQLTGHRFVRHEEPDAARMVADALAIAPYRWQALLFLDAEPAEAGREIPPTIGRLEPTPGGTLVHLGASDLDWLARYVAGLPFDAVVRHPPELRDALTALGRRLQRAHGAPARRRPSPP